MREDNYYNIFRKQQSIVIAVFFYPTLPAVLEDAIFTGEMQI